MGRFVVASDHPSLAGHFPGRPVVPGVVLLDHVMLVMGPGPVAGLPMVKFSRPVLPGQEVVVACAPAREGRVAFECSVAGTPVARGTVALGPAP